MVYTSYTPNCIRPEAFEFIIRYESSYCNFNGKSIPGQDFAGWFGQCAARFHSRAVASRFRKNTVSAGKKVSATTAVLSKPNSTMTPTPL